MVRAHGNVPAGFEGPGDDRLAQVGRRRSELGRRDGKRCLPRCARLEVRRDRRLDERVGHEKLSGCLDPAFGVGHVAFRVVVLNRASDLVQPQADQTEVRLPRGDLLRGGQSDPAGDPFADSGGAIEDDLACHGPVGRTQELLGAYVVERMATVRPGQTRPVQCVERRRGGSAVTAERS